jgi:hypothetical protein
MKRSGYAAKFFAGSVPPSARSRRRAYRYDSGDYHVFIRYSRNDYQASGQLFVALAQGRAIGLGIAS